MAVSACTKCPGKSLQGQIWVPWSARQEDTPLEVGHLAFSLGPSWPRFSNKFPRTLPQTKHKTSTALTTFCLLKKHFRHLAPNKFCARLGCQAGPNFISLGGDSAQGQERQALAGEKVRSSSSWSSPFGWGGAQVFFPLVMQYRAHIWKIICMFIRAKAGIGKKQKLQCVQKNAIFFGKRN